MKHTLFIIVSALALCACGNKANTDDDRMKQQRDSLQAIIDGKEAKTKDDPKAFLAEKEKEYNDLFTNPYKAAEYGYIDDVIEPRNTRFRICRALAQLANKREVRPAKKHGNIPL